MSGRPTSLQLRRPPKPIERNPGPGPTHGYGQSVRGLTQPIRRPFQPLLQHARAHPGDPVHALSR
ncbi:hypothetical protein C7212DRAFT_325828, partial [Tuber magnatum]